MPPIIFLNAAVILDGGSAHASVASAAAQCFDPAGARAVGASASAAAINELCRRTGGQIVISDGWGQRDARDTLRARGLAAPFHAQFQVDHSPQSDVGPIGGAVYSGISAEALSAAPMETIRLQNTPRPSPIARWRASHDRQSPAIIIDRPGARGLPDAIVVTVQVGAALGMQTVLRLTSMLKA